MITFAEIKEKVNHLSDIERKELFEILKKKRIDDVLYASEKAMQDYKAGKTFSLKSEQNVKELFNDLMNEDN